MSWEGVLGFAADFGIIATALGASLRAMVALVQLYWAIHDRRTFDITAFVDPGGYMQIQVDNKSSTEFRIQGMQLVQDRTIRRYLLRKLIGIDAIVELEQWKWVVYDEFPTTVAPRSTANLHAQIDEAKHDVKSLQSLTRIRPLVRLLIGGHRTLTKVQVTEGYIGRLENENSPSVGDERGLTS